MNAKKFLHRWRFALSFGLSIVLFVSMDVIAWQSLNRMDRSVRNVARSGDAEVMLARLGVALLEVESSHRGFLLTSDAAFRSRYDVAQAQVDRLLATLARFERMPAGDLVALRAAIARRRTELETMLVVARTDPARAVAPLRGETASLLVDDIHARLNDLSEDHQGVVEADQAAVSAGIQRNLVLSTVLTALFAGVTAGIAYLLRAEAQARAQAARAKEDAYNLLEQRVAERTAALERARLDVEIGASRIRALLNASTEAILTAGTDGRIVDANAAAGRAFGFSPSRLVGTPLELLFPRRLRSTQLNRVLHAAAAGEAEQPAGVLAQATGVRSSGEEFPLEGTVSYLHVDGSRLFTLVLTDLTEPQRVAATLREREAQQRHLLAILPDAVFVNRDGLLRFVNPTATTLFARSEGDLVGRSPLEFIAPEYHAQTRARIRLVLTQGKIAPPADVEVLRPDGSRRIVQATSTLIEDEGQPAILALMRDVTAVRAVEAELKQSHARLKALVGAQDAWQEEERKRVSREIHDDLQQALAALKIDLSMLARRLRAPSAGAAADAEAMEMLQAADALADAAIVSTRRVVENLRPRILDEGGLVDAIVGTLGDFERRTGIQARLNAREPGCESCLSPDCVTCLYRVFQEALNNVRKHSGATRVDVSLARIAPGEVRLRIHDDGRGIEPSDPEKPRSFGLLGMSERLAAVGGRMQLAGAPEEGTCLDAFVPCPACARDRPGE